MSKIKSFLRARTEWILITCGILLAVAITWILVWGVTTLALNLGSSLGNTRTQGAGDSFDLEGAAELDFRGLN